MKNLVLVTCAAVLSLSANASFAVGAFGFDANAISDTEFEVIPRTRKDIDGYWCEASDFARRILGASWQQQIYVLRGYGPSVTTNRRTAVQFSLTKPTNTAQEGSGVFSGFRPGDSMSVQRANTRCTRIRINS